MKECVQLSLFNDHIQKMAEKEDTVTPAMAWDRDAAKRTLDELFTLTFQYKTKKSYHELLQFVKRFRFYSPYNAMLVHIQMPGAKFAASPHSWLRDYGRRIKAGARPLVILRPFGPVMFVFDVSDTEPTKDAKPLPPEVDKPFEVRKGHAGGRLNSLIENAKRDGVRVKNTPEGSQSAGYIRNVAKEVQVSQQLQHGSDVDNKPIFISIPVKYDLIVNSNLSPEAQFATIIHELAHLYCGHLGTPDTRWWPDRIGLKRHVREFEAESVTYLVCSRANIDNPSDQYLSGYIQDDEDVPAISLECIMKAAGLIENMSILKMKPRKGSGN